MSAPTVVWRHYSGTVTEDGILWVSVGTAAGTHAVSGGGYAAALVNDNEESTDTGGNDASGMVPLAGMFPQPDPGQDRTDWAVGFAAPPGVRLRCHLFAVLAPSGS